MFLVLITASTRSLPYHSECRNVCETKKMRQNRICVCVMDEQNFSQIDFFFLLFGPKIDAEKSRKKPKA